MPGDFGQARARASGHRLTCHCPTWSEPTLKADADFLGLVRFARRHQRLLNLVDGEFVRDQRRQIKTPRAHDGDDVSVIVLCRAVAAAVDVPVVERNCRKIAGDGRFVGSSNASDT